MSSVPETGRTYVWRPISDLTTDDAGKLCIVWDMIEQMPAVWTGKAWMREGRVLRDVAWWRPEEAAQ